MLPLSRHWTAVFVVMLLSAENLVYAEELPLPAAVQAGDHDKIKSMPLNKEMWKRQKFIWRPKTDTA